MDPRFSVLLPTHDRADVVGYAIRSVLAQTEPDLELLVVGDGCTDQTAGVVTSFDDDRVRWFDLPKAPGYGYANRNVALREARGSLVAFIAHDDLLFPDHLERMARPFEREHVEWAYSRPLWIDDDGTAVPFATDLHRPAEFESFMSSHNILPASCVVHRRSILEENGYWPEDVDRAADWELWKRMLGPSRGANLVYVPVPTTIHFRASWRNGAAWGPFPLGAWQRDARSGWWPPDLRLTIPEGMAPQAYLWALLSDGRADWMARLRAATVAVVDGYALDAARQRAAATANSAQLAAAAARAAAAERALGSQRRHTEAVERAYHTVLDSTSWRMTAPLRRVLDRIRARRGRARRGRA